MLGNKAWTVASRTALTVQDRGAARYVARDGVYTLMPYFTAIAAAPDTPRAACELCGSWPALAMLRGADGFLCKALTFTHGNSDDRRYEKVLPSRCLV